MLHPFDPSRRRPAFTLIELLVVVGIIASLIAILLPSMNKAREAAKMVLCGTNQKAVLTAATVYASGNKDAYPPSIQGTKSNWWTLPNRLNYHSEKVGGGDGADGGWLGKRLYDYLPTVEVHYCPLAPAIPIGAEDNYRTGESWILNGSFFMLWSYDGYKTQSPGFFNGPERTAEARTDQLLISDALSWNDPGGSGLWMSSHPSGLGGGATDSTGSAWVWTSGTGDAPSGIDFNAGYVDGHVAQFTSDDTVWYHPGVNGSHPAQHYLPRPPGTPDP